MRFSVRLLSFLLIACSRAPQSSTALKGNAAQDWQSDIGVPVLCYHQIVTDEQYRKKPNAFQVTVAQFREQIEWLAENKFYTISPTDLLAYTKGEKKLEFAQRRPIVITFDDGNDDFVNHAQKILEQHSYKGVLFIYPSYIMAHKKRSLTWQEIRRVQEQGHYVESHTLWHPKLTTMSEKEQRLQFTDSMRILNEKGGAHVKHLAYPFGLYNSASAKLLQETGYLSAHTTFPGGNQVGEDAFHLRRYLIVKSDSLKTFARRTLQRSLPLGYVDVEPGQIYSSDREITLKIPPNLKPEGLKVRIFSTPQDFTYNQDGTLQISIRLAKKKKVSVLEVVYREKGIDYLANALLNHKRAKNEHDGEKKSRKKKRRSEEV